jgi:hypothetical protein
MLGNEADKTSPVDCGCDLCVDAPPPCDCPVCRSVRDELFAIIGMSPSIDDDELRFVNSEVQHEC